MATRESLSIFPFMWYHLQYLVEYIVVLGFIFYIYSNTLSFLNHGFKPLKNYYFIVSALIPEVVLINYPGDYSDDGVGGNRDCGCHHQHMYNLDFDEDR